MAYRTKVFYIKPTKELVEECRLSTNLYNQALYILRQAFINKEKIPSKFDLVKELRYKNYECDEYNNFGKMSSTNAVEIVFNAYNNFKAFLMSLKLFKKNKNLFKNVPKIPKYKEKDSLFMVYVGSQSATIKDGMMRFPKKYNLDRIYVGNLKIAHLRIFPYSSKKYKIEVVYKIENLLKKENGYIAGIDLGLNNLATVVINNENIRPLIINGAPLKALNVDFNNKKSKIQFKLKKCNNKYMSNNLKALFRKRNNRINTYLHKTSKIIINYCLKNNVNKIVIGHNKFQKQNSMLKNFTSIPVFRLIELLKYKAEYNGIELIEVNEAYTSGTSYLDEELPIKENYNKNRRIRRGLFLSNEGKRINADVNSAYQIIKIISDDVIKPVGKGSLFTPLKVNIK